MLKFWNNNMLLHTHTHVQAWCLGLKPDKQPHPRFSCQLWLISSWSRARTQTEASSRAHFFPENKRRVTMILFHPLTTEPTLLCSRSSGFYSADSVRRRNRSCLIFFFKLSCSTSNPHLFWFNRDVLYSFLCVFVYQNPEQLFPGETANESLEKQTNAPEVLKYTFKTSEILLERSGLLYRVKKTLHL